MKRDQKHTGAAREQPWSHWRITFQIALFLPVVDENRRLSHFNESFFVQSECQFKSNITANFAAEFEWKWYEKILQFWRNQAQSTSRSPDSNESRTSCTWLGEAISKENCFAPQTRCGQRGASRCRVTTKPHPQNETENSARAAEMKRNWGMLCLATADREVKPATAVTVHSLL